ncbi:MAG: S-layer homology domain-containing protein [Candidatus Gracilibacteria bacterium]
MATQKQKLKLLLFGFVMLATAFLLLSYQNGSLFKSDLLGSDMLNNSLNKVYHRLYSYDVSKNVGSYENLPNPGDQKWIQVTNTSGTGNVGSLVMKKDSANKSLGLMNLKTAGIGSVLAANNWAATENDKIEIETRVQVVGAAGCETSTSSFILFNNGKNTGYVNFCKNQIIVSSNTQRWQRNSQFAPGAKNTISNIDLSTAPKDIKIVAEGTKISVYEQKSTDILLGAFESAMYLGLPDYTGITNASRISDSALLFGSFATTVGSTNYGTETNWGYVRGKVTPLNQLSGPTKGSMSFSYDAESQKLPDYLGWTNVGGSDGYMSADNRFVITPQSTYKTLLNLQEYDGFDIEAEFQNQVVISFGTNKAQGYVTIHDSGMSYTKGSSSVSDSLINSANSLHKFKISVKGKEFSITEVGTGKTIVSPSGMQALSTPSEYGFVSFGGYYGQLKNIKVTAKPYLIDNTQDGSRKFTKEYGYTNASYPADQNWTPINESNNYSPNLVYNQYLSLRTAQTGNLLNTFKWNASKNDDISIEARLRVPQTQCAFSASNYLMFSNGDKMGYITFCQNEIRVSGAGLPFTKTLRYNQIFQTLPQNQRNVFPFSANMASEFATFKITLKDGKDIIITTPDNQTLTIANGLYFPANDASQSPYPNALVFGSGSNETTTTPETKSDWEYVKYKLTSRIQDGKSFTYSYDANLTTPPSAQGWVSNVALQSYPESAVTGQKTYVNGSYRHYNTYWNANTKDTLVIDTTVKSNAGCYGVDDSNTNITFSNGVTKGIVAFCRNAVYISDPSSGNGSRYIRAYVGEPSNANTIDNSTMKNFKIVVKNLDISVFDVTTGKEVATVWGGFNTPVTGSDKDKNMITFGGSQSEWKYFKATLSQELASTAASGDILRLHFANVKWSILDKTANTLKSTFDITEIVPAGTLIEMCTRNTASTGEPVCTKSTQTGPHTYSVFPSKTDVPLNNNVPVGGAPSTTTYDWFIKVNGIPYGVEGPLTIYHSPEILSASTNPTNPKIKVLFDTIQDSTAVLQVGVAPSQSQYTLETVCIQKDTGGTETCKNNVAPNRTMTNAPIIQDTDYNWSMYYAGFSGLTPGIKYKINVTVKQSGGTVPVISGGTFTTHKAPEYTVTNGVVYGLPQDTVLIPRTNSVNNILWTHEGNPAKANIKFDLKDATAKTVQICYKLNGATANTCNAVTTNTPGTTKTYSGAASGIDLTTAGTRTYLWNIQIDGKHFGVEGTLTVTPSITTDEDPAVSGTSDPSFIQSVVAPLGETSAHITVSTTANSTASSPSIKSFCIVDTLGNSPICQNDLSYTSYTGTAAGNNFIYDYNFDNLIPGTVYKIQYQQVYTNAGYQTFVGKSFKTSSTKEISLIPGDVIFSSTDNPVRNLSWVTNKVNQEYLEVIFDVLNLPTPTTPVSFCYKEENNAQATETCKTATKVSGTLFSVVTDIPLNSTKTYSWYIKIGSEKSGTAGSGLSITVTPATPGTTTPAEDTPLTDEGIPLTITNITQDSALLTATANVTTHVVKSICIARAEDESNEICNEQSLPTVQSGNATYAATFTNLLPGKQYTTRVLFTRGLAATDLFSRSGQKFTTATPSTGTVDGEVIVTPPTDTQAPAVVITTPANAAVFSKTSDITFTGTSSDLGVVTSGVDKIMIGLKATGADPKWLTLGTSATWETAEVYYPATGTETWTYNAQGKTITWENGKTYQVFVYGVDKALNSGKPVPVNSTFTYTPPVDTVAPTSTITLPLPGATSINGTARDEGTPSSGLKNMKVSIKNNSTNKYWNGTAFTVDTETYLDASLGGTTGLDTAWSYPASGTIVFEDNKSYTVHAFAEDNVGNKNNASPSVRTFTHDDGIVPEIDTQAPTVVIDAIVAADTTLKGSAIDAGTVTSGIKEVRISIKDNSTNKWFNGTDFTGTASAYIPAKITLTGAASATWVLPETGVLPFTANASYTASAYALDTKDNSSLSTAVTRTFTYVPAVVPDTTAPSTTLTAPATGATSLGGLAKDEGTPTSGLKEVKVSIKNNTTNTWWTGTSFTATIEQFSTATLGAVTAGNTAWSYPSAGTIAFVHNNNYSVKVYAEDNAGNKNNTTPATLTFTYNSGVVNPVDTQIPAVTIDQMTAPSTLVKGTVTDTGTPASGIASVKISIEDVAAQTWWNGTNFSATSESFYNTKVQTVASSNTTWMYPEIGALPFVTTKTYKIKVYAVDVAGNSSTANPATINFTYIAPVVTPDDTTAPSTTITTPTVAATSISGTTKDEGTATSGLKEVKVSLKDTTSNLWWNGTNFSSAAETFVTAALGGVSNGNTLWSYPATGNLPLVDKRSYTVKAYTEDNAGNKNNTNPATLTFTYDAGIVELPDTQPPTISIDAMVSTDTIVKGNAVDTGTGSGIKEVRVSIKDNKTGKWFSGSGFILSTQNYLPAKVSLVGAANTTWALPEIGVIPFVSNETYTITVYGIDTKNNSGLTTPVTKTFTYVAATHQSATPIISTAPQWNFDTNTAVRSITFSLSQDVGTQSVYFCIDARCFLTTKQADGKYYLVVDNTMLPVDKLGTYKWSIKVGTETLTSNGAVTVNPSLPNPIINVGGNNLYTVPLPTTGNTQGTTVVNNYYTIITSTGSTIPNSNGNSISSTNSNSDVRPSPVYCPPVCVSYTLPKDISPSYFAAQSIKILGERNIITGYADGTFKPNNPINRAEFAKIVKNGFLLQSNTRAAAMPFKDINVLSWFYTPIRALYNANLVQGYDSGNYLPGRFIQRDEAAKILSVAHANIASAKTAGSSALDKDVLGETTITEQWNQWRNEHPTFTYVVFPDVSVNDWSAKYVLYAYNLNLLTGRSTDAGLQFEAKELITRGEAATLLAKMVVSLDIDYPTQKGTDQKVQVVFPQ